MFAFARPKSRVPARTADSLFRMTRRCDARVHDRRHQRQHHADTGYISQFPPSSRAGDYLIVCPEFCGNVIRHAGRIIVEDQQ